MGKQVTNLENLEIRVGCPEKRKQGGVVVGTHPVSSVVWCDVNPISSQASQVCACMRMGADQLFGAAGAQHCIAELEFGASPVSLHPLTLCMPSGISWHDGWPL